MAPHAAPGRRSGGAHGAPRQRPYTAGPAPAAAAASEPEDAPEVKLGPNVAAGIREVQGSLDWRRATVTRNDAADVTGGQRLLHLSVDDDVSAHARAHAAMQP